MKYNKILIVGGIGAGKTTLAKKISKKLKIRVWELDNVVWKKRDIHKQNKPPIRDKKVKAILKKSKWIVEGFHNHPWTYGFYKKADIIIILKVKPFISKLRIIKRYLKRKLYLENTKNVNKSLKLAIALIKGVEKRSKRHMKIQKQIAKRFNKNIIILGNNKEINNFLEEMKKWNT